MSYSQQSADTGRHVMPDLVRAVALIGIALVNVSVIAYPLMGGYLHGGLNTSIDSAAFFLVMAFFTMKFYPLFSFMFGVGFAYQMRSAQKSGKIFAGRYFRRILGLILFGLINIAFLFQGDILILYAVLGSLLFLFRNASARALMRWGIGFFVIQILVFSALTAGLYLGEVYAPEEMSAELGKMTEAVARSYAVFGSGDFAQSIEQRFKEWAEIIQIGIFMDGMGAMAFFLFGLAAVKSDVIAHPKAAVWRRCRRVFLPIGIFGSLVGAYVQSLGDSMLAPLNMLGMTLIAFFALFLSAGYLGLIAKWAEKPMTGLTAFLARGGTASLTAYLMQGLILSLIFNAYGLGLFGKLDAIYCILIALAAALFTLTFTSLWRTRFTRGPMEYGLRKLTYLGRA